MLLNNFYVFVELPILFMHCFLTSVGYSLHFLIVQCVS